MTARIAGSSTGERMRWGTAAVLLLTIWCILTGEARSQGPESVGPASRRSSLAAAKQQHEFDTDFSIRELKLEVSDLKRRIELIYFVMGFVGLAGVIAAWRIVQWAKARTRQAIEKAIYAVDPTCRAVLIPGEGFEDERQRLSALGFDDLKPYDSIEATSLTGLLVCPVENDSQVEGLARILEKRKPDPKRLGCVLYTTRHIQQEAVERLQEICPNVTFANSAATLANALLVVGRGTRP
ncbi:MAG TPA: hypothetical protein VNA25_25975 [Phycisphaerae bacterium]|nr:hypothetical protein [Phycisphaerae bacterium]